jgi:hypothetical protein
MKVINILPAVPRTHFSSADVISTRSASLEPIMTDVLVWQSVIGKSSNVCTKNYTVHVI